MAICEIQPKKLAANAYKKNKEDYTFFSSPEKIEMDAIK